MASLDDEIENLQARVSTLKSQLQIQTSTLLAAPSTRKLLSPPSSALSLPADDNTPLRQKLLARSGIQHAHNQQCLYRACAGLTLFRAHDPDPSAVDGGAILGLRIEVVSRAKFLRPYYVLLNRPYPGSGHLRVHRHTIPACIPLAGLAVRWLPPPKGEAKQDLARFARVLRLEVVRYHHRLGAVADLRKAAGLGRKKSRAAAEAEEQDVLGARAELAGGKLVDITPADAEAKQISVEWADGRAGRLVMGDDGEIVKLVVVGEGGRDREAVRELLGEATTIEDVVRRLTSG
ncbi:Cenp-O kinetochore centromere component-domain-containing protein [Lasiosphaeris hirsuta]|uniref:Cenp-O kinetochore centromere component-domain-containing protein n=1 Tax=Lasiosphaeris hirsuta TaxID=260670 RepID=A0AA40E7H7_9PEZI|nr:Cenp-O kinetochore centromere component-domain-containing protein [Lasiosphaeris hirsuta]